MNKILLIDDDDMFRKIIARNLTKLGFEVIENASGENIKQQIQEEIPIACLLDMMIDEKDGKEIIADLQGLSNLPKIIAVSANNDYLQEVKEIGIDAILCKPITPVMLSETLSQLGIRP